MAHCTLASSRELGRRGRASTMRQNARRHRVAAREGSWLITASAAVGIEGREGTWRHVEATRPERRSSPLAARPRSVRAARVCVFTRSATHQRARHGGLVRRLPFHGACVRGVFYRLRRERARVCKN
jgi:hypothetical protein